MITLFIDTSTDTLLVALFENSKLLEEIKIEHNLEHSRNAIDKIDELLKNNNIKPKEVSKILVVNGPGSFTGIRIGVTIAKIYAWSLNIKVVPISTLKALAISNEGYDYYVPVIDARRECVYGCIYDKDYNEYIEETYISKKDLVDKLNELDNFIVIGDTDLAIYEAKNNNIDVVKVFNYYKDYEGINSHMLNPVYLKKTEAEEKIGEV